MFLFYSVFILLYVTPLVNSRHVEGREPTESVSPSANSGYHVHNKYFISHFPFIAQCHRVQSRKPDHVLAYLLQLCLMHDTELNPGPRKVNFPCGGCGKRVEWHRGHGICCDGCDTWFHAVKCQNMRPAIYDCLEDNDVSWYCLKCGLPNFRTSYFEDTPVLDLSTSSMDMTNISSPGAPLEMSSPAPKATTKRTHRRSTLRLLNVNAHSITNKKGSFQNLVDSTDPDIITCSETWLIRQQGDGEIGMINRFSDEYEIHRFDREDKNLYPNKDPKSGGVFVAVRKSEAIKVTRQPDLETNCEIVWVKIEIRNVKTLYVAGYYRRDKSDAEATAELDASLSKIANRTRAHIWIAGDFNYPGFNWEDRTLLPNCPYASLHERFLEILDDHKLTQVVTDATRDDATLDLIITNNETLIVKVQVIPGISDHDAVIMDSNISLGRNQQVPRQIPLWNKADWPKIREHIDTAWSNLPKETVDSSTADSLWKWFKNTVEEGIRLFVPHRTSTKKNHKPWMSTTLKKMIRKSKRLFRRKQDYPSRANIEAYRTAQRDIQKTSRREYWNYINGILYPDLEMGGDRNKKLWGAVKHAKKDSIGVAPLLNPTTGVKVTDPTEKAEVLNNQFQKAFSPFTPMKLLQTCKEFVWKGKCPDPVPLDDHTRTRKYPLMPDFTFGLNGIKKLLGALKPNKAAGPDQLTPRALKEARNSIAPILQVIFTKSYESGQVPEDWKTANVVPVYKKGAKYLPINYRPVSLTCICSKLMEHIIASQMGNHLEKNGILDRNQHGFRKGLSCETQLLEFVEDLHRSTGKGRQIDAVVMDFSKAFDKVPHKQLIYKLHEYGLENKTVTWIEHWLIGRSQTVVVEGRSSQTVPVTSGVPQGSVLGPILFLLFINDISQGTSSKIRLFADDTIIYRPVRSTADAAALQKDIDILDRWSRDWMMEFHPDKCKVIHITRSQSPFKSTYQIYNTQLEEVTSCTYLGVQINSDIRWNKHIQSTRAKAAGTLHFLQRNLKISNTVVKTTAYNAFVRPRLEYASCVWDPYTAKLRDSLEMIQRRAARWVLGRQGCRYYRASVSEMLEHLGWVSLERRRVEARLAMMYKMQNGLVKLDTSHIFVPMTGMAHSAQPHKVIPPQHESVLPHQFSFFPWTARQWNSLDSNIALAPSLKTFKQRVHTVPFFARPVIRQY